MRAALASPTAREDARATASMRGIESVESGGTSERWGEDGGTRRERGGGRTEGRARPSRIRTNLDLVARAGGDEGGAGWTRRGGVERD